MAKNILILSSSPHIGGASDTLCDAFMQGAAEAGHRAERLHLSELSIDFCRACGGCKNGACVIDDDMAAVLDKILAADVLVLASPIYFLSINARLKNCIDRTFARWKEVQNKELYYLLTAGSGAPSVFEGALAVLRGHAACIKGAAEKGIVCGAGSEVAAGSPLYNEALELGRKA